MAVIVAANDASLAELVIVGVLSGAFGAVTAAVLQIRHERAERLRERRLAAADDLLTRAFRMHDDLIIALKAAQRGDRERAQQRRQALSDETQDVATKFARVQLLFGSSSEVGGAAIRVLAAYTAAVEAADGGELDRLQEHLASTAHDLEAFVSAANAVIT